MLAKQILKIATRESKLAITQTNWVAAQLMQVFPGLRIELVKITTKGDKILDISLSKIGGKGLFVKELEEALLEQRADIAVHSLKDMPALQPDGLELATYCERADYRDVLISKKYKTFADLPSGANVGTASLRRMAQLKILRPDVNVTLLRGNVDTRIQKALADDGQYDAIILASAGVTRLQLEYLISDYLNTTDFLPAPGQGIIAIECRSDDLATKQLIKTIGCIKATSCAKAERAFNAVMGGSCSVPIAALAEIDDATNLLNLRGQVAMPDGSQQVSSSISGDARYAYDLGEKLAHQILNGGGRAIIELL